MLSCVRETQKPSWLYNIDYSATSKHNDELSAAMNRSIRLYEAATRERRGEYLHHTGRLLLAPPPEMADMSQLCKTASGGARRHRARL